MSPIYSSRKLLLVAILGVCGWGCSNSTGGGGGSGGSTSNPTGSGGASGTGGSRGSGGAILGTGGAGTGGASTSTGGNASGGAPGTGGAAPGTGGRGTGGASTAIGTGGESNTGGATTGTGGRGSGGASTSMGGNTAMGGSAAGGTMAGSGGRATGGTAGSTTAAGGTTGAGGSTTSGTSAGCGKTSTITSSQYNNGNPISITVGSMQRRYILHVPTGYDNSKPYKLVVAYHALNSNDHSVYTENYYGLLPLSNNTTIFVAPNGQTGGAPCTGTGTGQSGCGWPNTSDQDMQLADAVVKQVEDNFCVDTNHIFATGWSYGASMSEQTACERPLGGTQTAGWGVRAIAIYAVAYLSNSTNCKASKPVAYYATHGSHDSVLGYSGGVSIAQTWAGIDGCTWVTPTNVTSGAHVCTKLAGCTAGYPLEFCSFNGDHTAYPDNGQETGSWGPQEAWTFLSQF